MACFEKVAKDLKQVILEAPQYGEGVYLLAHVVPDNCTIMVDYIHVPVMLRRQGIATNILEELKTLADGHDVTVKLLPSDDFGTPKQALFALYIATGFTYRDNHFWYNQH